MAGRSASAALLRCVSAFAPDQTQAQLAAKQSVLLWLAGILRAWVADVRASIRTGATPMHQMIVRMMQTHFGHFGMVWN